MNFEIEGSDDDYDIEYVDEPTWKKPQAAARTSTGTGSTSQLAKPKTGASGSSSTKSNFMFGGSSLENDDVYNFEYDDNDAGSKGKSTGKRGTTVTGLGYGGKHSQSQSGSDSSPGGFIPLTVSDVQPKKQQDPGPRNSLEAAEAMLNKYSGKATTTGTAADTGKYGKKYFASTFDEDDISLSSDEGARSKGKSTAPTKASGLAAATTKTTAPLSASSKTAMNFSIEDSGNLDEGLSYEEVVKTTAVSKQFITAPTSKIDTESDDDSGVVDESNSREGFGGLVTKVRFAIKDEPPPPAYSQQQNEQRSSKSGKQNYEDDGEEYEDDTEVISEDEGVATKPVARSNSKERSNDDDENEYEENFEDEFEQSGSSYNANDEDEEPSTEIYRPKLVSFTDIGGWDDADSAQRPSGVIAPSSSIEGAINNNHGDAMTSSTSIDSLPAPVYSSSEPTIPTTTTAVTTSSDIAATFPLPSQNKLPTQPQNNVQASSHYPPYPTFTAPPQDQQGTGHPTNVSSSVPVTGQPQMGQQHPFPPAVNAHPNYPPQQYNSAAPAPPTLNQSQPSLYPYSHPYPYPYPYPDLNHNHNAHAPYMVPPGHSLPSPPYPYSPHNPYPHSIPYHMYPYPSPYPYTSAGAVYPPPYGYYPAPAAPIDPHAGNPWQQQQVRASLSPLGGEALLNSMSRFSVNGVSPTNASTTGGTSPTHDSILIELLKELKTAKEDAAWAKTKLIEMVEMVQKNNRSEAALNDAAVHTQSSKTAPPTASAAKTAKITAKPTAKRSTDTNDDEDEDEDENDYSNDFESSHANDISQSDNSTMLPSAPTATAKPTPVQQSQAETGVGSTQQRTSRSENTFSYLSEPYFPASISTPQALGFGRTVDFTESLQASQALFRRQLSGLRARLQMTNLAYGGTRNVLDELVHPSTAAGHSSADSQRLPSVEEFRQQYDNRRMQNAEKFAALMQQLDPKNMNDSKRRQMVEQFMA